MHTNIIVKTDIGSFDKSKLPNAFIIRQIRSMYREKMSAETIMQRIKVCWKCGNKKEYIKLKMPHQTIPGKTILRSVRRPCDTCQSYGFILD